MRTDHFFYDIYEDFRKWFKGTLVFSALPCRDFSFFLFSIFFSSRFFFFFFTEMFFKYIFYFCSLICILRFCAFFVLLVLFWCFWCFWCFLCFLCVQNLFVKKIKNKKFKTALITSLYYYFQVVSYNRWGREWTGTVNNSEWWEGGGGGIRH